MKKTFYSTILLLIFQLSTISAAQKTWISVNSGSPAKCNPELILSTAATTEVEFKLPGFFIEERNTPVGIAYSVSLPDAAKMLQKGLPDLPQLSYSLIIPDRANMKAEVISSTYTDYNFSIAPSKGNLKRDINPSSVAYSYDAAYSVDAFYPSEQTSLREPYILRDFRGQTVVVYPFSYNPVSKTLRVYTSLKIRVSQNSTSGAKNIFARLNPATSIDPVFASIYNNQFLNSSTAAYAPLNDQGKMLVISDPSLMSYVQPFVDWKNRMGQPTEMVDVSTIGTTPMDIKSYIENYYNTNGLTFVLLVGDGPQIPPYPSPNGDSDPSYGYLSGNDSYAEVIVGRFSANNSDEVITQVQRSMKYEMYPELNGQWYHKAVCIGSDQGPGDDNEMDFEHEQNIRTDLMNYFYSDVDELYDGSQGGMDMSGDPNAGDLVASIDAGRSLISYTGHGSSSSLGTTNFSSSDVSTLMNYDELPFIFSVACVNGDFNSTTCLAEELMRAFSGSNMKPTGAIATFMSTINQSWDPPMDAQDEMIDILVESYPGNKKHTFGGISVNGCMHMNDEYGTAGDEMTDTWTIFGDPSLMVRTNTPAPLAITHNTEIDINATTFTVGCTQNQALVCLSHNNQIVSTGWSIAGNAHMNVSGLTLGDTLDLVVTAYNGIPYFSEVVVTNATTGISKTSSKPYSFYPNPAKDFLNVSLPFGRENISLSVINAEGRIVLSEKSSGGRVDISSLTSGLYTILVSDESGFVGNEKLIVR